MHQVLSCCLLRCTAQTVRGGLFTLLVDSMLLLEVKIFWPPPLALLSLPRRRLLLHWCLAGSPSSAVWLNTSAQPSCPAAAGRCRLVPATA